MMQKFFLKSFVAILLSILLSSTAFGAVNFDGVGDYINCNDVASLDFGTTTDFSISFWVKTSSSGVNSFISKRTSDASKAGYTIWMLDGNTIYETIDDGLGHKAENPVTFAIGNGAWHNIILTADRDGNVTLDVDGTNLGSWGMSTVTNVDTISPFLLGIFDLGTYPLTGVISEVAVWNTVLTAPQRALLANSRIKGMPLQIAPANLKLYLPLDDHTSNDTANSANGLVFKDMSGNGNNGTASGCNAQGETVLSYPRGIQ